MEHRCGSKSIGVNQAITLKIAAGISFCAIASATKYVPLIGELSASMYWHMMKTSIMSAINVLLNVTIRLRFPSFSLLHLRLPIINQFAFACSIGVAVVSFLLPLWHAFYRKYVKECGRKRWFKMEEVILRGGKDHSDDESLHDDTHAWDLDE